MFSRSCLQWTTPQSHRANRPKRYHTRGKHHTGTLTDRLSMYTSILHRSGQRLCIWVRTCPGTDYHRLLSSGRPPQELYRGTNLQLWDNIVHVSAAQCCETLIQTNLVSFSNVHGELVFMQLPPDRYDVATIPFFPFIFSLAGDGTR